MAKWLCGSTGKYDTYGVDTGTLPEIEFLSGGILLNALISMAIGSKVEFDAIKFRELTYTTYRNITGNVTGIDRFLSYVHINSSQIKSELTTVTLTTAPVASYQPLTVTGTLLSTLSCIGSSGSGGDAGRFKSRSIIIRDASNNIVWQWLTQPSDFKSTPPNATIVGTIGWYYVGVGRHDETKEALLAYLNSITLTENLTIYDLDRAIPAGYFPSSKDGFTITMENSPVPSTGGTLGVPKCRLMCSLGV